MLLSSSFAPSQPQRLSPPYPQQQSNMLAFPQPQDGMWNDIEAQLSSMPAPSLSRRASTQRPNTSALQRGNSMRIVKPSQSVSTHNSPLGLGLGNKAALGRRMTVMGDTSGYRRRRLLEATAAIGQQQQQQIIQSQQNNQMRARAGTTTMQQRPMSWCPTMSSESGMGMGMESWNGNATQQQGEAILRKQAAQYSPESQLRLQQLQQWQQLEVAQQQLQMAQHQQVAQQQAQQQQVARIQQAQQMQMQAQQAQAEQNYFALNTGLPSSNGATPYFSQQNTPLQFPSYALPMEYYNTQSYASTPIDLPMDQQNTFNHSQDFGLYNNMNLGLPNTFGMVSTTPPTPETFPLQDAFQPQYISTESSAFSLDTAEDEGEVLVGLGLYSQPEKTAPKSQMEVHVAELYERAGVTVEKNHLAVGKGLKLEETWEPPKDEESEEEDAEGEEEEEEVEEEVVEDSSMPPPAMSQAPMAGWL